MKAYTALPAFWVFTVLGLYFSSSLHAKEKTPAISKCTAPLPRTSEGCTGEQCECRIGTNLAKQSTLYAGSSKKSSVLEKLKSGARLKSRKLFVVTHAYGHASLDTPEGKTVHVQIARYLGEGQYELCGWGGYQEDVTVIEEAKTEDWAQVVTKKGEKGWVQTQDLVMSDGENCE